MHFPFDRDLYPPFVTTWARSLLCFHFPDPSQPPSNFTASNESSTAVRLFWKQVPECCRFGIILGYHITLTDPYNASVIARKTTAILTGNFLGLKKFHKYDLTVEAFNSIGSSPKAFTSAFTDQDGKVIFHLFCLCSYNNLDVHFSNSLIFHKENTKEIDVY